MDSRSLIRIGVFSCSVPRSRNDVVARLFSSLDDSTNYLIPSAESLSAGLASTALLPRLTTGL